MPSGWDPCPMQAVTGTVTGMVTDTTKKRKGAGRGQEFSGREEDKRAPLEEDFRKGPDWIGKEPGPGIPPAIQEQHLDFYFQFRRYRAGIPALCNCSKDTWR